MTLVGDRQIMAKIVKIRTKLRKNKLSEKHKLKDFTFEVRDLREKEFFTIDNAYITGKWLRLLKGCPTATYFAICRHADTHQQSFPSIDYLMDETGYSNKQVRRAIKTLEFHRLIGVDRARGDHNIYALLNRKHWRKAIVITKALLTGPVKRKKNNKPETS